jgi:acetyl esterase/lipase
MDQQGIRLKQKIINQQANMSIQSRFFYLLLRAVNFRANTERQFLAEVATGRHPGHTGEFRPSRRLFKKCVADISVVGGRKVLTVRPKSNPAPQTILFFHGGAYLRNAVSQHWDFVYRLVQNFGYTLVVPDYPLAPEFGYTEAIGMAEACYLELAAANNPENIILMGDSAGGGLALVLAKKLRNEKAGQPGHIILLSPWLDVGLTHPDIPEAEEHDALLLTKGLKAAGKAYAKGTPSTNPMVSPIYGDIHDLGRISLFTGTYDILNPDAAKFRDICRQAGIPINYFEYPKMIHDWMILGFPESEKVIEQIQGIIGNP